MCVEAGESKGGVELELIPDRSLSEVIGFLTVEVKTSSYIQTCEDER